MNSKVVAIVVLNPEALPQFGKTHKVDTNDLTKLEPVVFEDVKSKCKEAGLLSFEIPGAIRVTMSPFSIESGVLTATSKIVRTVAKEFFKNELLDMYVNSIGEDVKL